MASTSTIQDVRYANPRFSGMAIEVMRLSELFSRVEPAHFRPPQRPHFHLLFFVTSGRGRHLIDFRMHALRRGTVLHVRPGQVQQFLRDRVYDAIVILFSPVFVLPDQALAKLSGHDDLVDLVLPSGSLPLDGKASRLVNDDFERLAAEYQRADEMPLTRRLLQHQLNALLLRLAQMSASTRTEKESFSAASRTVARFQHQLERRLGQTRRVDAFARWVGCAPRTLHASCITMRGIGPKLLIEQRLVLEAQRLLAHTVLPIDRIGAELGFNEPANFTRLFRRVAGVSPQRFRSSYAEHHEQGTTN